MEALAQSASNFFEATHANKLPSIYGLQEKGYKVMPADRIKRTRIQPINKTSFTPGETIRIDLPSAEEWLDLRKANLNFVVTLATVGGTYRRIRKYAHSLFARLRVEWGSSEILNIENWGRLKALQKEVFNQKKFSDTDNEEVYLQGGGNSTTRDTESGLATQYIIELSEDFFNKRVFPLGHLPRGSQISIFLDIDSINNIIETDGVIGSQVLTLSDVYLWYDSYKYNSTMRQETDSRISKQGIRMVYDTLDYHSQSVPAASTSIQHEVNTASRSVNTFFGTLSQTDEKGDPTVDDEYINTKPFSITKLQFNSQGDTFPQIPYETMKQLYQEALRGMNRWDFRHGTELHHGITPSLYLTTKGHIYWDFRHHNDTEWLSTGIDNNGGTHLLRLEMNMASIGADALTFHVWVGHTRRLHMTPDGSVERLK